MNDKEKIIEMLERLHPEVDGAAESHLCDDGILDSMDIVMLVTEMNMAFGLAIPATEILPENFNSAQKMAEMVVRVRERDG